MEENRLSGIKVNGNLNIVQGNNVKENHDDGIEINGNDNSIFGNELEDNTSTTSEQTIISLITIMTNKENASTWQW